MKKICSECSEIAKIVCKCVDPEILLCDIHLIDHLKIRNSHTICSIVDNGICDNKKMENFFKQSLTQIRAFKGKIINQTQQTIDSILQELKHSINQINKLEGIIIDYIQNTNNHNKDWEKLSRLQNVEIFRPFSFENLKSEIKSFYFPLINPDSFILELIPPENLGDFISEFLPIRKLSSFDETVEKKQLDPEIQAPEISFSSEEIIFSSDYNKGKLSSINLSNLKMSVIINAPAIGSFGVVAQYDQNLYFIYAGVLSYHNSQGSAYVYDSKNKKFRTLPSGICRSFMGAVVKNSKVYVFGGSNKQKLLNLSQRFDLKTEKWENIPNLPIALSQVTASRLYDDIILSGYQANCVYLFNGNTFSEELTLNSETHKVVMQGFVLCNSKLYEHDTHGWKAHVVVVEWSRGLLTWQTFKRNEFFYFIDSNKQLMRINSKNKVLECVAYISD